MNRPMIGVVPLIDEEKESYWMLPGYMTGIEAAGGLPVMLPLTVNGEEIVQLAESIDGFLFTGGQDVAPSVYGEKKKNTCGEPCPLRDEMERKLLQQILKLDKPFLGICRGIQFINAALGGSLYQDLPTEHPSVLEHHQAPPYDLPVHEVILVEKTPLAELLGKDRLSVNSYHHQAVKALAPMACAMAYAVDGLVEALYLPERSFAWALQWHPEFSYQGNEDSRKIFGAFVEAAGRK